MSQHLSRTKGRVTNQSCWLLTWALVFIAVTGCGHNARYLTVDESAARDALTTFLTAWQSGQEAADLEPQIVGRDSDWQPDRTLESFEVLPEDRNDGANLYLTVRRTIKPEKGPVIKEEVGYVVSTSPSITVFRSDQ